MPINWKKIPQTSEYQQMRLAEREDFLNRLYDREFGGNEELKSLSPDEQQSIRKKALQVVDPNLFGMRRVGGTIMEGVSGFGANVIEGLGGAAEFALKATGTRVEVPEKVKKVYGELTERRSEPEKWGAAVAETAQLALPFGAEAKAANWISRAGRLPILKYAPKVLGTGKLGRAAEAIGKFGAEVTGQVAAQGTTLFSYDMLHGKDAKDAFEYAKTAAYYTPGDTVVPLGFATWGPIVNRIFRAKWLPMRVWDYDTKTTKMQWGKQGLASALQISAPAWLIKAAINAPGPKGFLSKNPERAVIEEGIHAATLRGYLSKVGKRVETYSEEAEKLLETAKKYGGDADVTEVMKKLKEVLVTKREYSFADPTQLKNVQLLMDKITAKLMPPRAGGRLFMDVIEAQRLKAGFGREINWYKGVSKDVWDAERQLYHLMDQGIDNAVEIARGNIRNALYGQAQAPGRGQWGPPFMFSPAQKADLQSKLTFLSPAGRLSVLNDKIASLISAEKGLRNVITGTFGDHAKFWGIRLGPAGAFGAALGLASMAPGYGAAIGYGILGTPPGRQVATLGLQGLVGTGGLVQKAISPAIAKTAVGPRGRQVAGLTVGGTLARGFAAFEDQFGRKPYSLGEPDTPLNDPLGLRKKIREQQYGQPNTGGESQAALP